jgi:hypothetical protein
MILEPTRKERKKMAEAPVSIAAAVKSQMAEVSLDDGGGRAEQTYPPVQQLYPPQPPDVIDGTADGLPEAKRPIMDVFKVSLVAVSFGWLCEGSRCGCKTWSASLVRSSCFHEVEAGSGWQGWGSASGVSCWFWSSTGQWRGGAERKLKHRGPRNNNRGVASRHSNALETTQLSAISVSVRGFCGGRNLQIAW